MSLSMKHVIAGWLSSCHVVEAAKRVDCATIDALGRFLYLAILQENNLQIIAIFIDKDIEARLPRGSPGWLLVAQ